MSGTEEIDVVVVGAGQAGLATSHELTGLGVAHQVLDRAAAAGGSWATRWHSFCLVTPNHLVHLPGGEYRGDDPHGYLPRDALVRHLQDYAASFGAPVRTGVDVTALRSREDGRLVLRTADGTIVAREVVLATGAFPDAHRPPWVAGLAPGVVVVESGAYRSPAGLPPGAVLVVGSGQSGCQIAEELVLAGRRVVLACGRAPWVPRRVEDRDVVDCLVESGFMDRTLAELPSPAARFGANPQATGTRGGHDLHTRTMQALGVELAGHLAGVSDDGWTAVFADDLTASMAFGDAAYGELRARIQGWHAAQGRPVPQIPEPPPFDTSGALVSLDLHDVGAVVLAGGYRPAYRAWVEHPDAFDAQGFPLHHDGASTVVPGLSFVGVHFLRRAGSALLLGVGDDAAMVARGVAARVGAA